jgi:hypothetical protein
MNDLDSRQCRVPDSEIARNKRNKSLKVRNMRLQTERTDVDRAHIESCAAKLERLMVQRADLGDCLDQLLGECARGESSFKVYRQFNDPKLNPAVYGERLPAKRRLD